MILNNRIDDNDEINLTLNISNHIKNYNTKNKELKKIINRTPNENSSLLYCHNTDCRNLYGNVLNTDLILQGNIKRKNMSKHYSRLKENNLTLERVIFGLSNNPSKRKETMYKVNFFIIRFLIISFLLML